ncbi:MAG: pyridoxal phosphate-dependent aminotransferase [Bacteroidales bacterium]|nr:pyridoxal phosphate-dependent aminotransferase [Bacteroidales bacterium]
MDSLPISADIILEIRREMNLKSLAWASIREIVQLVNRIQEKTLIRFIRTEMGVPGLSAPQIAIDAEIEALRNGVASVYPPIEGKKELKHELSRFIKLFLNIDVKPEGCIPTVGSMQGSMACFLIINKTDPLKDTTLFIDPGFPVQKRQLHILGFKFINFDIYNFRGRKLRAKLEEFLARGDISTFIYSNPNNPSWFCFTENELKTIGETADKYGVIVIEDLAYFGMDFRKNYGKPGVPPYQPTVANYTDNYILLFSSSKAFSYAGQRIGSAIVSDKLFYREFPNLSQNYSTTRFGQAFIQDAIYSLSAGTAYSAQSGFAAILKAVNNGEYDFVHHVREYGERAKQMKKLFLENGFKIVYDKDEDRLLADGFYFTISYPDYSGEELLAELLRYGVSAITLDTTGSERTEGLRICVSQTRLQDMQVLKERLEIFRRDHS